jgi:hypothetical protein
MSIVVALAFGAVVTLGFWAADRFQTRRQRQHS